MLFMEMCVPQQSLIHQELSALHTHTHTSLVPRLSPRSAVFGESLGTRLHTHTQYTDNKAMVCMNLSDFVWAQSMLSMRNDNQN